MTKTRTPRKTSTGSFASIINGVLYFEDVRQCTIEADIFSEIIDDKYLKSIRLVSLPTHRVQEVWITGVGFAKEDINLEMTLRKEKKGVLFHWYAYRRVHGVLHKRYVGQSDRINVSTLVAVAQKMPSL